ncbi:MAG: SPOR domain-containing protein [Candidatus Aminicenantes bacterium]|nr:SPOR domain-containing protein [Candidatus Aminicenantes bacterium]
MNSLEKSYLEIKVTLMHIVILLVGVIIIGIFLFYLGYQAGKSSLKNQDVRAQLTEQGDRTKEINILDDNRKTEELPVEKNENTPSINEEMKLHQQPVRKHAEKTGHTIKGRTVKRESYYSVQVGAFSSFTNAKNYAAKFGRLGYPTEILSTTSKNKTLYRVRVGNFKSKDAAEKGKKKLERMEKKKFAVRKSG